eukprot:15259975-Alexandrium_andersonii.AAC.1
MSMGAAARAVRLIRASITPAARDPGLDAYWQGGRRGRFLFHTPVAAALFAQCVAAPAAFVQQFAW